MDLPKEQFDSLKELAEVQMQISTGQAALSKLKTDTKSYLELREKAAHDVVEKVLKESVEALESTNKNHAALREFASGLRTMALELSGFSQEITTLFSDFLNIVAESNAKLDVRLEDIRAREKEVMIQREAIDADQKALDREMKDLRDGKRLLADRQAIVNKTVEQIKKITGKKIL